jgi:hypothetical protein
MVQLIKRGGFREKTSRQSRYQDSVNHQADVPQQPVYQPGDQLDKQPKTEQEQQLPLSIAEDSEPLNK